MKERLFKTSQNLHQTHGEIVKEVTSIATYYPDMIKVYVPFAPINKIPDGWELSSSTVKYTTTYTELPANTETSLERSIRRSQRLVHDYILCNSFDLFVTITVAHDRHNIEHSKQKLNTWLKNQRDRNGKFSYVIVPEYHKDRALHFHGVLNNYTGTIKQSRSSKTGRILTSDGKPVYELSEYKSGFTKVQYIGNTAEDQARVGGYIRKYITKDMVSVFGKKRFWASQGFKKPYQEDNPTWIKDITPDSVYENDYGKIYTYTHLWSKAIPEEIISKTRLRKR